MAVASPCEIPTKEMVDKNTCSLYDLGKHMYGIRERGDF
jgi:hypothetical protein